MSRVWETQYQIREGIVVNAALARIIGRRSVLSALVLALFTAGLVAIGAKPALADPPPLCSGDAYSACTNAGYTDHGYGANNSNMYWHEFAGHNCTNYVAYVEIQNGFSSQNTYNPGNGQYWGGYFSGLGFTVNGTPAVGSVAWWNANQGPADSSGHVAYVEAVHKDANGNVTSIDISEDNWQFGPFDWKNIPVGSSNYPVGNSTTSGFIHLNDLATPQLTGQPVVVTNPDGSLSAYARGSDGTLKTTWQFGYGTNWHTFVSLGSPGGGFTSDPVIKQDSKNGGAQSAFMIGKDGALYNSWQSSYGSTWSAWASLGSPGGGVTVTGQPVVITNPDGSLSVFALGSDHNLKTTWQYGYGTNWHSWVSLGSPSGNLQGTPVIMQDAKNGDALSAFMIGTDGALYTMWQSSYGSTWSAWTSLGSPGGGVTVKGQPVVVTNPDGSLSAYALGSDGNLKTTWQYGYGTNWHSWVSLGSPSGNLTGTPVITQDIKNGDAESAFMIGSGTLYTSWQSSYGSTWSAWASLGGNNFTVQPVLVTNPDGSLSVFALGSDHNLWTVWQYGYGTNWHAPVSLSSAGNGFTSTPVITQDAKNGDALNAFMIGTDGTLWTSWQSSYGSTWSAWTSLGP